MQSSELLSIIRALPKDTLRRLGKYLHSSFGSTHEGVARLYDYLKTNRYAEDGQTLSREAVYQHLYPDGTADTRRVYDLTHYLMEAIERFLAIEWLDEQPALQQQAGLESLRKLKLADAATAAQRQARKQLDANPQRGHAWHRSDYQLQLEAYALSLQQGRAKEFNLQALSNAQDLAFLCEKLRTGCMLLSHQAVSQQRYDFGLLDATLHFLEGHPYLDLPEVACYYHGYYAQKGGPDSEPHFQRLKNLLQTHGNRFSASDTHDLYLMAINYCIRRINQGEAGYSREVFDLYRSGLDHGALLEEGALSRWTYNNIAFTALRLREFDWAFRFLHDYAVYVPAPHREAALHFNLARYYYDTGQPRAAMQHLLKREYDDLLQNLVAKVLLAKIYYEINEFDALENHLDSIAVYLRRKKVLGYHKENYTTIVRFFRRLQALAWNQPSEVEALRTAVLEAKVLTERAWFLERLVRGE